MKKDVVLKVILTFVNPTKKDMIQLTNAVFVAKKTLVENTVNIGYLNNAQQYSSSEWLHSLNAIHTLSLKEWSDETHQYILDENKKFPQPKK
jgi:hypothetical protein